MFEVTIGTVPVLASNVKITKILNNYWTATFDIPNDEVYRALVASTQDVDIKLSGVSLFTGSLIAPEYKSDRISCGCLDKCQNKMDGPLFSGLYPDHAVNTIMTAICAAAGVTWGSSITYIRRLRYDRATCLYAAVITCAHCGTADAESTPLDWWTSGLTFYMGVKGSSKGVVPLAGIGSKRVDRSKVKDKVTSKAWAQDGTELTFTKGTGTTEYEFTDRNVWTTLTTVENTQKQITNRRYLQMNEPVECIPVEIDIVTWMSKELDVGDKITVVNAELALDGEYRIMKAVIADTGKVSVDLVKAGKSTSDELIPDVSADSQAAPAPTNLPPVVDTNLGANTTAPPAQTVAYSAFQTGLNLTINYETWTDIFTDYPNVDHERLFYEIYIALRETTTGFFQIQVRIYNQTDNEYYPDSNGIVAYYPIPVATTLDLRGIPIPFLIVIPKNLNGKTIKAQLYHTYNPDLDINVTKNRFGHSHHTHPAYVSPADHDHAIDEAKHTNPVTDRRRSLWE